MTIKYPARAKAWALASACLIALLTAADVRAQDRGPFHFTVLGCAHIGMCESRDFAQAAARMRELKPDLVIFLGGMVDIPRTGDVEAPWRQFDSAAARLGAPVYNLPGTCRWGPLEQDRARTAQAEKYAAARYPKRFYSFKFRNNLFILLDSDSAGGPAGSGNGALSEEQLAFLKKEIAGSFKFDNVFIFVHNAQWLRENLSAKLADVYPLLLKKVKYVFSAKEHSFSAEQTDGLSYIITGTPPCAPTRVVRPVMYHFLDVTVNGNDARVSVVPMKGVPVEMLAQAGKGRKAGRNYPAVKGALMDSAERKAMLPVKPILAAMNIKPGMRIADVGAGVGVFTFPLAEALNGTGMVFATDTDPDMVNALERAVAGKGLKNVTPVSVSGEGLDTFYKKNVFDIMLFSEVYHYIDSPADYFSELKASLAKDTGRVFILHFRNVPDFSEIEIDDFPHVVKVLRTKMSRMGDDSPALAKAAAGVEEMLAGGPEGEVPQPVRDRIVANLNGLLGDPQLFSELKRSPAQADSVESPEPGAALLKKLAPHDLNLARWLLTELGARGALEKQADQLTADEKRYLKALNRILISAVFKFEKLDYIKGVYPVYAEKERIIADMEKAGYKLAADHDFLTYHHFLEFQ